MSIVTTMKKFKTFTERDQWLKYWQYVDTFKPSFACRIVVVDGIFEAWKESQECQS